ncbi:IS3 family transposase [Cupriavidus necator]
MKANQVRYPLSTMARLLKVSRSGFHAWNGRPASSARVVRDQLLLVQIREIHAQSHGTYGMPRVHAMLLRQGIHVGRKRVARLMRQAGLRGVCRPRFVCTTQRALQARPAPDLVQRHFCAEAPNVLWVADATFVPSAVGFYYLAVVLDVYSRRIVGWAMGSLLRTALMLQALDMAVTQRHPNGVIHHSDQGWAVSSAKCNTAFSGWELRVERQWRASRRTPRWGSESRAWRGVDG